MEEWVCQNCGHQNDYDSGFCVKCTKLRSPQAQSTVDEPAQRHPVEEQAAPTHSRFPWLGPPGDECQVCGRSPTTVFSFTVCKPAIGSPNLESFYERLCRTCAQGQFRRYQGLNLRWGWIDIGGENGWIGSAWDNLRYYRLNRQGLAEPTTSLDPKTEWKLRGTPVVLQALPGLIIPAALVATWIAAFVLAAIQSAGAWIMWTLVLAQLAAVALLAVWKSQWRR